MCFCWSVDKDVQLMELESSFMILLSLSLAFNVLKDPSMARFRKQYYNLVYDRN